MNFLLNLLGGIGGQTYIYLALVFGSFSAGFYVEHLRFVNFQDEVKIVAQKQEDKTKSIEAQHVLINQGIQNEYEGKLAALRNYYGGVQLNSSSRSMPGISPTPKGADAATAYPILVEQCSETTLQVNLWQEWATKNGLIQ